MHNQRLLIETIFALPRVVCGLLCSTILVLGFYANDVQDVQVVSESSNSNVASVKADKGSAQNRL